MLNQNYVATVPKNIEHTNSNWGILCMWWNILDYYSFNASNRKKFYSQQLKWWTWILTITDHIHETFFVGASSWTSIANAFFSASMTICILVFLLFFFFFFMLRSDTFSLHFLFWSSVSLLFCIRYMSLQVLLISSSSTRFILELRNHFEKCSPISVGKACVRNGYRRILFVLLCSFWSYSLRFLWFVMKYKIVNASKSAWYKGPLHQKKFVIIFDRAKQTKPNLREIYPILSRPSSLWPFLERFLCFSVVVVHSFLCRSEKGLSRHFDVWLY